jgi:hypothetical protein
MAPLNIDWSAPWLAPNRSAGEAVDGSLRAGASVADALNEARDDGVTTTTSPVRRMDKNIFHFAFGVIAAIANGGICVGQGQDARSAIDPNWGLMNQLSFFHSDHARHQKRRRTASGQDDTQAGKPDRQCRHP